MIPSLMTAIGDHSVRTTREMLAHPAMTSAIVGVQKPSHILSLLPAIDVKIDESILREIRAIAAS